MTLFETTFAITAFFVFCVLAHRITALLAEILEENRKIRWATYHAANIVERVEAAAGHAGESSPPSRLRTL